MTSDIAKKLFEIIGDDKVLVNVVNGNTALDDVPFIQLYKTDSSEEITSSGLCLNVQMFQRYIIVNYLNIKIGMFIKIKVIYLV